MPAPGPSDELLAACRAGDREAFGRLFDVCRDRVYAIAFGMSGDRAAAADISQEVFVKLLTRISQFQGRAAFNTWLYRLVVNATIDHQRMRSRLVALPDTLHDPKPVDEQYARRERRQRVQRAVQMLPSKLRTPIVLRHIEGLSYQEIAAVLGVSAGTVASRLARAHVRLARQLAGEVT
jgi:RNA polymerase sigma-70 factor (ECF subfamily)